MRTRGFDPVEEFRQSVAQVLGRHWPDATAAGSADLSSLWAAAVAHGWFEIEAAGTPDLLVAAVLELGRRACPIPLADAYIASLLLDPAQRDAVAVGDIRPVVAVSPRIDAEVFDCLDAPPQATHVLVLCREVGAVALSPVRAVEPLAGLALPPWGLVRSGKPIVVHRRTAQALSRALALHRLGVAARVLGAISQAHDLAVEHARNRRQFGRLIGEFGAVQQRIASCHIEVTAATLLLSRAARDASADSAEAGLSAMLATRFIADTAASVMYQAQHTLGAAGYFEEHQVPWLFRRMHADLTQLRRDADPGDDLSRALVEGGRSLPPLAAGDEAEELRREVRDVLRDCGRPQPDGRQSFDEHRLRAEFASRGLFALGWPAAAGGRAATAAAKAVVNQEVRYARAPLEREMSATNMLALPILRHGSDAQQAEFLPLIRSGQLRFCLGYSEPESGSDLASLRTSAVRAGPNWLVNGQKAWTTHAQDASHVWLAVRTDPLAARRNGITVFLVPMSTPGIHVQQHVALSGAISCTVTYNDVLVPDSARVGEVGGGWRVITDALMAERVSMGGVAATMHRQLDELLRHFRADPAGLAGAPGSASRERLASLAARLHAGRTLVLAATESMQDGATRDGPTQDGATQDGATRDGATRDGMSAGLLAPAAAVLTSELAEEFGRAVLDLLGPRAALDPSAGGIDGGAAEQALRRAPMYVIGGGTNDIQRGLIARGLGLPREGTHHRHAPGS
jgi:alkylation response protein AidB-like acyl-CoA dehydrogenase